MDPAAFALALGYLRDACTPMADAAAIVRGIMGSTNTRASLNPNVSWTAWENRLDGRHGGQTITVKSAAIDQLSQWPTTDGPVLGQWWTFWRNEYTYAIGCHRRPRELKGFYASKPGLEAACLAYQPHLDRYSAEIWMVLGWLGRWHSITGRQG